MTVACLPHSLTAQEEWSFKLILNIFGLNTLLNTLFLNGFHAMCWENIAKSVEVHVETAIVMITSNNTFARYKDPLQKPTPNRFCVTIGHVSLAMRAIGFLIAQFVKPQFSAREGLTLLLCEEGAVLLR